MSMIQPTHGHLRLHPHFDTLPDSVEDERFLFCGGCDFFCWRAMPAVWEAHAQETGHVLHRNSMPPALMEMVGALPEGTVDAAPAPKMRRCRTCGFEAPTQGLILRHYAQAHPRST